MREKRKRDMSRMTQIEKKKKTPNVFQDYRS